MVVHPGITRQILNDGIVSRSSPLVIELEDGSILLLIRTQNRFGPCHHHSIMCSGAAAVVSREEDVVISVAILGPCSFHQILIRNGRIWKHYLHEAASLGKADSVWGK